MSNTMDSLQKKEDAACSLDVPWKYLTVKGVSKSVSTSYLYSHVILYIPQVIIRREIIINNLK